MNYTTDQLKEKFEELRSLYDGAINAEPFNVKRHKEVTEACEKEVEKLGYSFRILTITDDVFKLTFSTAEKRPEILNHYKL